MAIVLFAPDAAFQSSLTGLKIWWNYVFPVLLPYFVLVEIAILSGSFQRLGLRLEKLCRKWFRLPGIAGPVMLIGWLAGYPAGAQYTVSALAHNPSLGRNDGEKLLILSYLCSPVLVVNLIAVMFLQDPLAAPLLWVIQFISLAIISIALRLQPAAPFVAAMSPNVQLQSTFPSEMVTPPFGQMLSTAVKKSVQSLFMIGGIMMVFSVGLHFTSASPLAHMLSLGIAEVHIGTYAASELQLNSDLKVALISAMLAFGGFSVHAQVKSIIWRTSLRYQPFLFWKIVQSVTAFLLAYFLWEPYQKLVAPVKPSFSTQSDFNTAGGKGLSTFWHMPTLMFTAICCIGLLALFKWANHYFRRP